MKIKPKMEWGFGDLIGLASRVWGAVQKMGLVIIFAVALTGCGAYVGGYGDYGGYGGGYDGDDGGGSDLFLFGGNYDRGGDVHNYSHRGSVSRSAASGGGGHVGGSHGGGGHGGGGHGGGGHGGGGGRR
jgi:hypothetical protein